MKDKILEAVQISKTYGEGESAVQALKASDLTIWKGEFASIIGSSGSGKSTLLKILGGLLPPTTGNVLLDGQDLYAMNAEQLAQVRRQKIGFIFQDFNLLDTLTAYENIALALSIQNEKYKEINLKVKKVAYDLGIEDILNKYPYEMSGGQKQRVASARAIINNPKLILADEPTGALDSKSSRMLLERFEYLNNLLQATILMVTHDAFSASYSSRAIFIKDGKIFNEIVKGDRSRKEFFNEIINVVTMLGGDLNDAL